MTWLIVIGLVGLGAMYVDGLLLQQGVASWGRLLALAAGGMAGMGIVLVVTVLAARDLLRRA